MRDFNQVYISPVLETYFGKGFRAKWGLNPYNDPTKPSIFLGLYNNNDINAFLNHKSHRIITWGGADMVPQQLNIVKNVINDSKTYTWGTPGSFSNTLTQHNIPHKSTYIPYKSYNDFHPTPLGENIYVYKGIHGDRPDYFKWNEIIDPLIHTFGKDRVIHTQHTDPKTLKEEYYDNCFVYIKPSPKGGCTTMWELAHMGRRTIGNGMEGLNNFTQYDNINHLLELIMDESKYIGQLREDISLSVMEDLVGDEWLNLKFWK